MRMRNDIDDRYPIGTDPTLNIVEGRLVVDRQALNLLPTDLPSDLRGTFPVTILGDGNSLPRSASVIAFGSEESHIELRTRIVVELATSDEYLDNSYLNRGIKFCERGRNIC